MHLNYYFLRILSDELREKLIGFSLVECYLQNRFECVLSFSKEQEEFLVKLNLYPEFTCIAFPEVFHKSKKGTYQLFHELIGRRVVDVVQHKNDRSFYLVFENELNLMFKLHGSRSNLILFHQNNCIDLLNKNLHLDRETDLDQYGKDPDQSFEAFARSENIRHVFLAFDTLILKKLKAEGYDDKDQKAQWEQVQTLVVILCKKHFYINEYEEKIELSFFQRGTIVASAQSALQACSIFEQYAGQRFYFSNEKHRALNFIKQKIKKSESYLATIERKKEDIEAHVRYDEIANIIMANLHLIPKHSEEIELFNFYTEKPIVIKLKRELSPQKNAENYYRKSKNQKLEIAQLEKTIGNKTAEVSNFNEHLLQVEAITDLKSLRKYLKENDLLQETSQKEREQEQLFRRFEIDGFEILVGKSAKNNDVLTQKHSFKEDLWLHARDVAGSHVLIKYKAGKKFPKHVIEKAAQLAAYYSKRKTDSLCPVIVTPKKYVRKPKGALEGQVIVEREEVLLVKPSDYDSL